MRLVLGGFALGVAILQQQRALPDASAWYLGILLASLLAAAGACARRVARSGSHTVRALELAAWAGVAVLAGFGYAAWRAELRLSETLPLAWEGRPIVLTGSIRGLPVREAGSARFVFSVDADDADAARRGTGVARFPRTVQLSWSAREGQSVPALAPGERWQLSVRLKRPHGYANFGGRDSEAGLFARGIRASGQVVSSGVARRLDGTAGGFAQAIDRRRYALASRIDEVLSDSAHRGIIAALAVGAQHAIAADDRVVLQRTGTSHLVAISGLHIGFVAGAGAVFAAWLWRRSCLLGRLLASRGLREWPLVVPTPLVGVAAGALCAAAYAALAGFNVPAQRALSMLCVVGLGFALGRSVSSSAVLCWAAALVLAADPWAVVSAGFWLSFGAVAVISLAMRTRVRGVCEPEAPEEGDDAVVDPSFDIGAAAARDSGRRAHRWRLLARRWLAGARERCAQASRAQYAVTIGLAPLTAAWFSQVSLVGPPANALAVPWVSLLVTPGVLVAIALPAPLDAAAYEMAHALLAPLMQVLKILAAYSWAEWRLACPAWWAVTSALIGTFWLLMPRGWPLRFAGPLAWLPLVLPPPSNPPAGTFRLTALDVGQGSAIVIETARHAVLFDAGPGPESTRAGERIVAPYLQAHGIATLDALVVSHADADHAGGAAAVLGALRVRQLLGGLPPANRLWDSARAAHADGLRCVEGQRWRWDGVEFSVLWPPRGPQPAKSNAHSCVLRVRAPGFTALLTGDIDAAVERKLMAEAGDSLVADVLLVAHHGSRTSSVEPFLDSVDPRVAVFQVGYRNRFGHPHPDVWSRFAARGIELARTDRDGAVRIGLEAGVLTLERYRDSHRRYWMDD